MKITTLRMDLFKKYILEVAFDGFTTYEEKINLKAKYYVEVAKYFQAMLDLEGT